MLLLVCSPTDLPEAYYQLLPQSIALLAQGGACSQHCLPLRSVTPSSPLPTTFQSQSPHPPGANGEMSVQALELAGLSPAPGSGIEDLSPLWAAGLSEQGASRRTPGAGPLPRPLKYPPPGIPHNIKIFFMMKYIIHRKNDIYNLYLEFKEK